MYRNRSAFTLVELLVVVAIIGILVGLLLPAVQAAREAARRASCANNVMQLAIAVSNYEMAHRSLPPGTVDAKGPIVHLPIGFHHSWIVQILPMLDESSAYKKLDHSQSIYSATNFPVRSYELQILRCPSSPNDFAALSSYAGVHDSREVPIDIDNNGVLFLNSHVRYDDITDGVTHTLLLGEKHTDPTELGWSSGTRSTLRNMGSPINQTGPSSNLGGGLPPGFGDGLNSGLGSAGIGPMDPSEPIVGTLEDLSIEPNGLESVRQKESKYMGSNPYSMLESDPKTWLQINQLPSIIPGRPNPGSDVGGFGSYHTGGANFAMADGAVMFISRSIDANLLQQLANRADGILVRGARW
jgi:prepilin-type N-terminal cleavage/methylation domain-containing protein/prepilin-type processing-associated H-X9-DG protein